MKKIDHTGRQYGDLTVLCPAPKTDYTLKWVCRCSCGVVKSVRSGDLKKVRSCGHLKGLNSKKESLVGQRFGTLTATEEVRMSNGKYGYICKCDCGNLTTSQRGNLITGTTKGCGCTLRGKASITHGLSTSKNSGAYRSWLAMKQRCLDQNQDNWENYGGRGITFAARWLEFANFLCDMGERPAGKSLDRVDNNGNYEPGNCKWSTAVEQSKNKRPRKPRSEWNFRKQN